MALIRRARRFAIRRPRRMLENLITPLMVVRLLWVVNSLGFVGLICRVVLLRCHLLRRWDPLRPWRGSVCVIPLFGALRVRRRCPRRGVRLM